ncbi:hypothetical protein [Pseudotabrizicola algicola]|uniref:Sulfotransferase family protein n=1 Tax=Pseudotabrizicola algicola TaxID=2709381 RepID=A0A6B3RNQ7_9RHOB|nr:hypothetical protein [Pseudotabrizicola algicola]NEX47744.1 hypothetical protein [Pseudotabrizicola algicola]
MARQHLILNMGLARCGTTATAALFSAVPGMSTPEGIKELKFFMSDAEPQSYTARFTDPAGPLLFESSPPYTGGGTERYEQVLTRVMALRDLGFDVTLVFMVRNLLARAFSHYWHDISSQYAPFGRYWSVQTPTDPRRFRHLYTSTFLDELQRPKSADKFLPKVAQMIGTAIAMFGVDRVHIGHTNQLDAALQDLMQRACPGFPAPLPPAPRLRGSRAPLIVTGNPATGHVTVATRKGPMDVPLAADEALLVRDKGVERLSAEHYDIPRLADAFSRWTRSFDCTETPPRVADYLQRQSRAMSRLPVECFLAGQRASILKDLTTLPERLEIGLAEPEPDNFSEAL